MYFLSEPFYRAKGGVRPPHGKRWSEDLTDIILCVVSAGVGRLFALIFTLYILYFLHGGC